MYSNFEKLGHKYGLTQLSLSYDTPKSAHDIFLGSIKFSFFGAGGPHNVGFQLSQKNHGSGFYPVLEINWADMEKDAEQFIFDRHEDNKISPYEDSVANALTNANLSMDLSKDLT